MTKSKELTLSEIKEIAKRCNITTSGTKAEVAYRILKLRSHLSRQAKQGLSTTEKKNLWQVVNSKNKNKNKSSGWFGIF